MKSYGQLCAVARALDIVGDRWTLLIVRELLIEGSLRFTDVQRGLPGVAPNLLTQRLRDLESHGVLVREEAAPPASGTIYSLTPRGRDLDGVVRELLKWGAPTVWDAPPNAHFQMHWLSMPAAVLLRDNAPGSGTVVVRFGEPRDGFDVVAEHGIRVGPCDPAASPGATVDGPGPALVNLIVGLTSLADADAAGITIDGDLEALRRVLPSDASADPR